MTANDNIQRMLDDIHRADTPRDDAWFHAIETAVCSLLRAQKQHNRATPGDPMNPARPAAERRAYLNREVELDHEFCTTHGWFLRANRGQHWEFERLQNMNPVEVTAISTFTAREAWGALRTYVETGHVGSNLAQKQPEPNVTEDEWTEINRLHDMLHNSRGLDKETLRVLLTEVRDRLAILILKRGNRVPQTKPVWTAADGSCARKEGWDIFDSSDHGQHIERCDSTDRFESDDEALEHVRAYARNGSARHQKALAIHEAAHPEDMYRYDYSDRHGYWFVEKRVGGEWQTVDTHIKTEAEAIEIRNNYEQQQGAS